MLVRLTTALGILLPILGERLVNQRPTPWWLVFVIAGVAFGLARVVEAFLGKGQPRARRRLGWSLMFGSSALSCAYALRGAMNGITGASSGSEIVDAGPAAPWLRDENPWQSVSSGAHGICAVKGDNQVYCRGDAAHGWPASPAVVPGIETTKVMVGDDFACVKTTRGEVRCWRAHDVFVEKRSPSRIDVSRVLRLAVGSTHACAVDVEGAVSCWGTNRHGESGGRASDGLTPVRVAELPRARDVAAGDHATCAVLENGEVWCWGAIGFEGTDTPRVVSDRPVRVDGLPGRASSVALGRDRACSTHDRVLHCWGAAVPGDAPRSMPGFSNVDTASVGTSHLCAVLGSGRVRCTGANERGQLGTENIVNVTFNEVPAIRDAFDVTTGDFATCILTRGADPELVCWGLRAQ